MRFNEQMLIKLQVALMLHINTIVHPSVIRATIRMYEDFHGSHNKSGFFLRRSLVGDLSPEFSGGCQRAEELSPPAGEFTVFAEHVLPSATCKPNEIK